MSSSNSTAVATKKQSTLTSISQASKSKKRQVSKMSSASSPLPTTKIDPNPKKLKDEVKASTGSNASSGEDVHMSLQPPNGDDSSSEVVKQPAELSDDDDSSSSFNINDTVVTKNLPHKYREFNGTIGKVTDIDDETGGVVIQTVDGKRIGLMPSYLDKVQVANEVSTLQGSLDGTNNKPSSNTSSSPSNESDDMTLEKSNKANRISISPQPSAASTSSLSPNANTTGSEVDTSPDNTATAQVAPCPSSQSKLCLNSLFVEPFSLANFISDIIFSTTDTSGSENTSPNTSRTTQTAPPCQQDQSTAHLDASDDEQTQQGGATFTAGTEAIIQSSSSKYNGQSCVVVKYCDDEQNKGQGMLVVIQKGYGTSLRVPQENLRMSSSTKTSEEVALGKERI